MLLGSRLTLLLSPLLGRVRLASATSKPEMDPALYMANAAKVGICSVLQLRFVPFLTDP